MTARRPTTTTTILGVDTGVESALARLLKSGGYSISIPEGPSSGQAGEQLEGVDLLPLTPDLVPAEGER